MEVQDVPEASKKDTEFLSEWPALGEVHMNEVELGTSCWFNKKIQDVPEASEKDPKSLSEWPTLDEDHMNEEEKGREDSGIGDVLYTIRWFHSQSSSIPYQALQNNKKAMAMATASVATDVEKGRLVEPSLVSHARS
ncbi:hypothetical protein AVEN_65201-1 [Araneus ventricosus]|uniref:Uncharacterized protein n=1 Tax=Araneus ventricosus TaxID=182803 RepID=A0A4Y2AFP0_ARAVE|nr:hypothetical protein AVEN_65201-1 [Araneus ventricosus]